MKHEKKVPVLSTVNDKQLLLGKTALITGGSGGIGVEIAKTFIQSGCKVIISGTSEDKLKETSKRINADGYVVINMKDPKTFDAIIDTVFAAHGNIDILVCCAGVNVARSGFSFGTVTEEEYDFIMDTNAKGTFFICQSMANKMKMLNIKGHILMVSSNRGIEPGTSPYGISKACIDSMTLGFAKLLINHGIVVNSIAPGPTLTSMQAKSIDGGIISEQTPINRLIMPSEVAEIAKILVSDLGNTIVGDTIYLTGGRGLFDIR